MDKVSTDCLWGWKEENGEIMFTENLTKPKHFIYVITLSPPKTPVECMCAQSCLALCNTLDYSPPLMDSPGKNTGVGSHALLQGIFLTQVSCLAGRFFTVWATREAQKKQLRRVKIGCLWEIRLRVGRGRARISFIIKSYSASFVFLSFFISK